MKFAGMRNFFFNERRENMGGITRNVKDKKQSIRKELIQRIKYCGQYIVDNAETILGEEKYIVNLYLTCNFFDRSEVPYITVNKDIIPDGFIEERWVVKTIREYVNESMW